jgi:aryl-alcohol dehydrogenase-like predicted oxidoreductase
MDRARAGRYRKDAEPPTPTSSARQRLANRYDLSLPENQRKLEAAEALAQLAGEQGCRRSRWLLRWSSAIPPIIGPRTMEQLESQLPAADVVLDAALLDRIDEIVRPASTSTPPTAGGPTRPCSRPRDGARDTCAVEDSLLLID